MNKQTSYLFVIFFLLIFIMCLSLYWIYQNDKHMIFYATVKEAYNDSAIIVPFPNEEISGDLFANISDLKIGQIIKVTSKKEIKETYPAMIEVIRYEKIIDPTTSTTEKTTITTTMPYPDAELTQ